VSLMDWESVRRNCVTWESVLNSFQRLMLLPCLSYRVCVLDFSARTGMYQVRYAYCSDLGARLDLAGIGEVHVGITASWVFIDIHLFARLSWPGIATRLD
jgi:hypothetical protein